MQEIYEHKDELYHESWLKRNSSYIKFYGVAAIIIAFGIFPWIVGIITILTWFL